MLEVCHLNSLSTKQRDIVKVILSIHCCPFQGKYVPPDRSDIVTEINETCDDDKNEEEDADQNDLVEDVTDVNETECGQDLSCHDADIDLD